jgi:hypothetical protein
MCSRFNRERLSCDAATVEPRKIHAADPLAAFSD